MDQALLERDDTLAALIGAVEDAAAGHGSVVLISGGAGLGKTSVVRAFAAAAAGRARVLLCSCDDLIAPRTLGPLRDAALESGGSLAAAFADDRPVDDVFTAVMAELAAAPPTALVVEDVHWADDATIDVLGYVARRDRAGARRARPQLPRRRARPVASAPAHARRPRRAPRPAAGAAAALAHGGAAAGGEHRRRRRRRAPGHRRQPVLRHRGAGLARGRRPGHRRRGGPRPRRPPGPRLPRSARAALGRALAGPRSSSPPTCSASASTRSRRRSSPGCWRCPRAISASATSWHGARSSAACRRSRDGA